MIELDIKTDTNLGDLEALLSQANHVPGTPIRLRFARQRKHQFFKDPAVAQFFATLARTSAYTLVDWHNDWNQQDFICYYGEDLAGLSGATFAASIVNTIDKAPPVSVGDIHKSIASRHGLLKPFGEAESRVRELAFLSFDDQKPQEPAALAGLIYDLEGFVRKVQKWRENVLDIRPDYQQDLFSSAAAPREIMEFLHELYQNGAEHGNKNAKAGLIKGIRSFSLRRHHPGSMSALAGFAKGFPELERYIDEWSRLNRGTSFFEVSVNDVGLGIIDRFIATRPEFTPSDNDTDGRLKLLLRILLTPKPDDNLGAFEQAYSSKDVSGQERGAGRGLERALDSVRKLNGFVSLRTGEFWLYRSFPTGEDVGQTAMHLVAGGPFAPVVGTCFAALFPISLRA